MSFTPNIPQSGQSLGQTRDNVRNNFANYNTVMSVNHVAPNNAGQGKHNFCEFPTQGVNPNGAPATSAGEVAVYCKTIGGVPELFMQKENQLANAADIQLSKTSYGVLAASNGYTFLPGGIILQWANFPAAGNNTVLKWADAGITLPNFPTACWKVFITTIKGAPFASGTIYILDASITTSQFTTVSNIGANVPIQVLAIGN